MKDFMDTDMDGVPIARDSVASVVGLMVPCIAMAVENLWILDQCALGVLNEIGGYLQVCAITAFVVDTTEAILLAIICIAAVKEKSFSRYVEDVPDVTGHLVRIAITIMDSTFTITSRGSKGKISMDRGIIAVDQFLDITGGIPVHHH